MEERVVLFLSFHSLSASQLLINLGSGLRIFKKKRGEITLNTWRQRKFSRTGSNLRRHNFYLNGNNKEEVEEGTDILGHFRELQFTITVGIEHLQLSTEKINNKQTIRIRIVNY